MIRVVFIIKIQANTYHFFLVLFAAECEMKKLETIPTMTRRNDTICFYKKLVIEDCALSYAFI